MSWHHETLVYLWLTEPLSTRLSHIMTTPISNSILVLAPIQLQEFLRKGRTLSEVDRWKATKFWTFLLYAGCTILTSALEKPVYRNFLCLMVAVTILAAENLCQLLQLCGQVVETLHPLERSMERNTYILWCTLGTSEAIRPSSFFLEFPIRKVSTNSQTSHL